MKALVGIPDPKNIIILVVTGILGRGKLSKLHFNKSRGTNLYKSTPGEKHKTYVPVSAGVVALLLARTSPSGGLSSSSSHFTSTSA